MDGIDTTADELLPVIVAELEDEGSRDMLEAVAFAEGEICVPLLSAPVDASRHVLEVYSPGDPNPLLLLAVSLGPPSENGFLLRLSMYEDKTNPGISTTGSMTPIAPLRSRFPTANKLTAGHAAALAPPPESRTMGAIHLGRFLAAGKLQLERLIGSGGMGLVYRAMHQGLSMPVAVKVLHEHLQRDLDFCRRFHAEALAASRLDHPNLTRVLDFGQEPDGLVYIAMEFLAGQDLRSLLQKEGKLGTKRIVDIMTQVSMGLTHVHTRGMVHRDMKPDNVVLVASEDEEGRPIEGVKLCDFGIAVARGASSEIVGTPEYMSPEQCQGADLDARSDLYACGVMLYEMATGQTPFEGHPPAIIVAHHLQVEPAVPEDIDPRLAAVIMKALRKAPNERFQSARELRHALRALLAPPPLPEAAKRATGRGGPAWLEPPHASGNFAAVTGHTSGNYAAAPISARAVSALSDSLATDPVRWLSDLGKTSDPRKFITLCAQLEDAVPILAVRSDVATLWRVRSTLALIADEGPLQAGSRATAAHRVIKLLQGASVLSPAAEDVLYAERPSREAQSLIVSAGVAGAYALYGARAKSTPTPDGRARFTRCMLAIGAMGWPVLRAALEQLATETQPGVLELVEDLLASVPEAHDDAGGEAIALYVRATKPRLRRAAADALVLAWGVRARPFLVALLQDPEESVRVGAIGALQALNAVDLDVVRRLGTILERAPPASPVLRTEASAALRQATGSGRTLAREILERVVLVTPSSNTSDDAVLLAASRSLVALAGKEASSAIVERAGRAEAGLKKRLLAMLETG